MRSILATLMIALVALAGCAESGDPAIVDDVHDHGEHVHDDAVNMTSEPVLVFAADTVNGTAPLLVNFTIDALNATDVANATWSITFGDGNATNGTGLPAIANYTFGPGNFTTLLNVTIDGIALNATLLTEVLDGMPAEVPRQLPEKTHFEFADSLGCAGDVLQIAGEDCFSFIEGPSASGIDGYWLELTEEYWGLALTSTVDNVLGDSDCAITDGDFNVLSRPNGAGGPCAGKVDEGAAWLFIYSYAEFAMSQTVDFAFA